MTAGADHPSVFELDVHFAQGLPAHDPLTAHVAGCAGCRAYLTSLDAAAFAPRARSSAKAPRTSKRWATCLGVGVAAAAALVLWGRSEERWQDVDGDVNNEARGYVGVKGTPAVETILRTRAGLAIWDGRTALQPRDALAFRLACEGYEQVAVLVRGATEATSSRAYSGHCPARATTLPFSLVVDDRPGNEAVTFVFSRHPLPDHALTAAAGQRTRDADIWVVTLSFPKGTLP